MGAPAIYGDLSPSQLAAYSTWIDALYQRADHALDCRGCASTLGTCPIGAGLHEAEQTAWASWHAIRREERG